jgi:hypothetical protein
MEAPRRIDDQNVCARISGLNLSTQADMLGLLRGVSRMYRNTELLSQPFQLVDCGRPVDVRRYQVGMPSLFAQKQASFAAVVVLPDP